MDLLIAAIAFDHGLAIATSNTSHFECIDAPEIHTFGQPESAPGKHNPQAPDEPTA